MIRVHAQWGYLHDTGICMIRASACVRACVRACVKVRRVNLFEPRWLAMMDLIEEIHTLPSDVPGPPLLGPRSQVDSSPVESSRVESKRVESSQGHPSRSSADRALGAGCRVQGTGCSSADRTLDADPDAAAGAGVLKMNAAAAPQQHPLVGAKFGAMHAVNRLYTPAEWNRAGEAGAVRADVVVDQSVARMARVLRAEEGVRPVSDSTQRLMQTRKAAHHVSRKALHYASCNAAHTQCPGLTSVHTLTQSSHSAQSSHRCTVHLHSPPIRGRLSTVCAASGRTYTHMHARTCTCALPSVHMHCVCCRCRVRGGWRSGSSARSRSTWQRRRCGR